MAPIRKGDGTPLEIPGVSEVRSGDGRVFFEGVDAIPDSAIRRFILDDHPDFNDSVGATTTTNNGIENLDGDWVGGSAATQNDTGDGYITLDDFTDDLHNVINSGSFSIAYTVQGSSTDDAMPLSLRPDNDSGGAFSVIVTQSFLDAENTVVWDLTDDGDSLSIRGPNNIIDDSSPHRCVIVCDGPADSASSYSMYKDADSLSVTTERSALSGDISPIQDEYILFARYDQGSLERFWTGVIDDFIIFDDSLTSSQVNDDYERQPWS